MKTLRSVLLVDDNQDDNFFTRFILERGAFAEQITECQDGREALEYLKTDATESPEKDYPDLVFLDINMPIMDGWELLETYEKMYPKQGGPVFIILTTSLCSQDLAKSRSFAAVKEFRTKPLTPYSLQEIHEKYVSDTWELTA